LYASPKYLGLNRFLAFRVRSVPRSPRVLLEKDYDGGDCCECTCVTDDDYQGCGNGFACIDPEAPCVNDDDLTTGFFDDCDEARMGDASCDDFNVRVANVLRNRDSYLPCVSRSRK